MMIGVQPPWLPSSVLSSAHVVHQVLRCIIKFSKLGIRYPNYGLHDRSHSSRVEVITDVQANHHHSLPDRRNPLDFDVSSYKMAFSVPYPQSSRLSDG